MPAPIDALPAASPAHSHAPSREAVAERARAIDGQVRDLLRTLRQDAYERSPEEAVLVQQALAMCLSGGVLAQDFTRVLPPEVGLRVLSHLRSGDVARVARVNQGGARLARTALNDSTRIVDQWVGVPFVAQRAYIGSRVGFVTACDAGPEPCVRDASLWAACKGTRLVLLRSQACTLQVESETAPGVTAFSWSADGCGLVWTVPVADGVQIWRAPATDVSQAAIVATVAVSGTVNAIVPHPRVPDVVALGVDTSLVLCRGAEILGTVPDVRGQQHHGEAGRMVWHADGRLLVVVGDERVRILAFTGEAFAGSHTLPTPVTCWSYVAWHPTQPWLVIPSSSGLKLWDLKDAPRLLSRANEMMLPCSHQTVPAFSPCGRVLVVRTDGGWLGIYAQRRDGQWVQQREITGDTVSTADRIVFSTVDPHCLLLMRQRRLWVGTLRRRAPTPV